MHAAYWLSLPIPFLCTPSLPLPQGHTHSFDCTFSHTYTLSYTHTLTHTNLVTHSLTHSHTRSHTHTQTRKQSQSMTERGYLTVVNFTILTDLLSATHDKFLLAPICTAYTLSPTRHPPTHPPMQAHAYARKFRLNEGLVHAIASTSNLASLSLILLFGIASSASGLFASSTPSLTPPSILPPPSHPTVAPLLVFCVAAMGALGVCVARAKQTGAAAGGTAVGRAVAAASKGAWVGVRVMGGVGTLRTGMGL